jgi:hypothetical protein
MLSPRKEEQYLEILSDVEYSGDVQWVVIIKFVESGLEIFWTDLPYMHEDKLMIGMTSKEHCKELVSIF